MLDEATPALEPRRRGRWILFTIGYVVVSAVWLYPVLRTPVIADDFLNPFQQATSGGPGVWAGVRYGWNGAIDGASFRLVGNTFGGLVNAVWLETSVRTGIRLEHLYGLLKLGVLVACAMSLAWFASCAGRMTGRRWPFRTALVIISAALFSTLQIHAFWSNDPVVSYPLSGFGAVAAGIASMTMFIRLTELPSAARAAAAGSVALGSFLYYELNLAALVGAGVIVLAAVVHRRRIGQPAARLVTMAIAAIVPTAVGLVAGRFVTGGQAAQYSGTTTRLGGLALETFVEGMISCLPGAAWELSDRLIIGGLRLSWWGALLGLTALAAVVAARRTASTVVVSGDEAEMTPDDGQATDRSRVVSMAIAVGLVTYWVLAVGLQAMTVKVQDESRGIGYVYTASAVGTSIVALMLAWVAVTVWQRRWGLASGAAWLTLVVGFVAVQQSVNWRLSSLMETTFIVNSRLLAGFDDDIGESDRCARLERWAQGAWPDYYEIGMIDGLQTSFDHYYGEDFCAGFVRPS